MEILEHYMLNPQDDSWNGERTATFNKNELRIITNALGCAENEGIIYKEETDIIFDKLGIEHLW